MALKANIWVERTPSGEKAWRESDLPLMERRLLSACYQRSNLGDLYNKSGELVMFEETIQILLRKGFLAVKEYPFKNSDFKSTDSGLEVIEPIENKISKNSGLRDLLGRIKKSQNSQTTTSETDLHQEASHIKSDFSLFKEELSQTQSEKESAIDFSNKNEKISDNLNDFAKLLMMPEEDDDDDDISSHDFNQLILENKNLKEDSESIISIPKSHLEIEISHEANLDQSLESHLKHHEEDDDEGGEEWLKNATTSVFIGAKSTEVERVDGDPLNKLNDSIDKISALQNLRKEAAARGAIYKQQKELERENERKNRVSEEIKRKVASQDAKLEAVSFKSISEQLKELNKKK